MFRPLFEFIVKPAEVKCVSDLRKKLELNLSSYRSINLKSILLIGRVISKDVVVLVSESICDFASIHLIARL
jgi:hypothetical protein